MEADLLFEIMRINEQWKHTLTEEEVHRMGHVDEWWDYKIRMFTQVK